MKNKLLNHLLVNKKSSIKETMRVIDRGRLGIAFVVDRDKKLFSVVTDGDIRRAILGGINIEKSIEEITNKKPIVIKGKFIEKEIQKLRENKKVKERIPISGSLKIPVLDELGMVRDIVFIYANKKDVFLPLKSKLKFRQEGIKKVLLTGGAGYLGSVLCRKLLNKGYKVRVLDNLTYGDEGIKELYGHKNFEFIKGDVRNISEVIETLREVDAAIHLAAIVGDPASQWDPKKTIEINYLSTKAVAEACKYNQINKFLFTSTCSVYGASKNPNDRLDENSPLNPVSLYAETKIKSEEGILSLADENFLPTIFRFGTLYGVSPRMRFDLVINTLTAKAAIEKKISIFGGNQWRPNLDVSDAAEACVIWLESPIGKSGGEIFNVGGNKQNYKIIEIGKLIKKNIPETEVKIEKGKDDSRDYNVSFDKIAKVLGFKVKKTMEKGILEIKNLLESKKIKDFNQSKYNNYRFLSGKKERITFK